MEKYIQAKTKPEDKKEILVGAKLAHLSLSAFVRKCALDETSRLRNLYGGKN